MGFSSKGVQSFSRCFVRTDGWTDEDFLYVLLRNSTVPQGQKKITFNQQTQRKGYKLTPFHLIRSIPLCCINILLYKSVNKHNNILK